MKLVFIDEFKPNSDKLNSDRLYGISVVVLDSAYYTNYKNGFEKAFTKLGWSREKELKGRYVYSSKIFEDITIDQRLGFAEELFKLSLSESGKKKRISVFIGIDSFDKKTGESEVYVNLLCKVLNKIGRPSNKKQDKNLIAFFLDNNDEVTRKIKESDFYSVLSEKLHKNWIILEKPFFVSSSNLLPGIIFADFISYFHQNFIDSNNFHAKIKERFLNLLDKSEKYIDDKEKEELKKYITNSRKKEQAARILEVLRDIVYV
ncbi:TPA: hypothetical protein DCZ46_01515 [Candidatus Campbellbacteria bacterium]|nr:MAG: hypothetical protein UR58_C0001G0273 [Candidatus Campbellbacteria bacterium GW2011_OD1_34_28]KKP75240.1 MAG: hypothetical protein UR74_C0001G0096 [Candidatus Campbellbacteria bacterium GW2011_GWD2_35_24]KKP76199.1 MAG: hypothetical protein UR75_C0001G0233 [Candidatus Campbellbacteria bacterium GW2011_GWC2_35_28]KKP77388.1 MAG: hypothetical protein UR76_C0001G0233 [Candidatus Campbellbacteria bacterium GW2011_GWC1_35_31]KKP79317.1 MAG: hypothetical protein UR79_C0001G0233 [Candidatus Cam